MNQTDFNDLAAARGLDAVKQAVDQALNAVGAADSPSSPAVSKGPRTRADFDLAIEECDDIDYLIDGMLLAIAKAQLKQAAIESLLLAIAKKASTTKGALLADYKAYAARFGAEVSAKSDDDVVDELNKTHAVLLLGGKTVIMSREYEPVMKKKLLTFSSKADFELRYCNKKVWQHGEELAWGEYWLNHPDRAQYKGLVFLPGENEPGYCNLWQGWGTTPAAGRCQTFKAYLFEVIANQCDDLYDYMLNWFAHMVQKPQELPETALVMRGREGIGKDTLLLFLSKIVGNEHYLMLSSMNQVTGRFSGHLANAFLVFCNESVWGGDKSAQGVLKTMITDKMRPIEYKGRDLIMMPSYLRMIFATNEQWAVPRGEDDRRYVIADVSDCRKGDWSFFAALRAEMAAGGVEALHAELLARDISSWHPRHIPDRLLRNGSDMKVLSAGSIVKFWLEVLMRGWLVEDGDQYSEEKRQFWPTECPFDVINSAYLGYCNRYKINHPEHSNCVGKKLAEFGLGRPKHKRDASSPTGRTRMYTLPSLDDARLLFVERLKMPVDYFEQGF
jgi:hypothetical protein